MNRKSPSTYLGKAFLWLIAVAVAALVEGYLLASTEETETLSSLANLQEIPANMPEAAVHVDRVVEFVNFLFGLFQLAV